MLVCSLQLSSTMAHLRICEAGHLPGTGQRHKQAQTPQAYLHHIADGHTPPHRYFIGLLAAEVPAATAGAGVALGLASQIGTHRLSQAITSKAGEPACAACCAGLAGFHHPISDAFKYTPDRRPKNAGLPFQQPHSPPLVLRVVNR